MAMNTGTINKNSAIGIFRGQLTPIDRLVETTVGRQDMLEDIIEKLQRNAGKRGGQHYLYIGPRGIGKTHFLTLVENAAKNDERLNNFYTVIQFTEENNRILSFADVLLSIVEMLAEIEKDSEWKQFHKSLLELERDEDIIDTIIPRLRRYRKETGKTLLLLMENLDVLFTEQIKREQDIHRFRSFLMDSPSAALVGTSPVYFPGLSSEKSPLYDFFDIKTIEDLTEGETLSLIRKNLKWEKREDILKDFENFIPKIQALHTMTGGNPRLTMMLYELIAHDNILDVKVQFQKLLDQISPFYQDRLKDLAPQERALLETMALMREEPRTPANIAAKMRMKPQQISSLLKRMTDAGYLTVLENPKDKRSRLYRIKEGFFDLWLAMSESRVHRKRLGFLTTFFELYYRNEQEREHKRDELWGKIEVADGKVRENTEELIAYLSDIGDDAEKCKSKIELAIHKIKKGDMKDAGEYLHEIESMGHKKPLFIWMTEQARQLAGGNQDIDVRKWLDDMIQYWKVQRTGDLEKAVDIAYKLGIDLSRKGLHRIRVELLKEALLSTQKNEDKLPLLSSIATSERMEGNVSEALDILESILTISQSIGDRSWEGSALNNISIIYQSRGDFDASVKFLEDALEITRKINDKEGEETILNNLGQIYIGLNKLDTALKYLEESLKIAREIDDKKGIATVLDNLGSVYKLRNDNDTAFNYLNESLNICRQIGYREGEGAALNNISQLVVEKGDDVAALKYLEESLKIQREIGDRAGSIPTLHNIATIEMRTNKLQKALEREFEAWNLALKQKDAHGLFYVGKYLGRFLLQNNCKEEAIKMLRIAYNVGKAAQFSDVEKIAELLQQYGATFGDSVKSTSAAG